MEVNDSSTVTLRTIDPDCIQLVCYKLKVPRCFQSAYKE